MKSRTAVPLILFVFLSAAGYPQSNTCAYTFTYPKANFSFCVTIWGTLGSIQSPIGVNHLDAVNPVEGWSANLFDSGGGSDGATVIPGLGVVDFTNPPAVRQPNGPGTLPLIFDYEYPYFREVISAAPYQRVISMSLIIRSCPEVDCNWSGQVSRVANIRADGNSTANFAHSSFAAFGYVNHGVALSVDETACAGTDPNGASTTAYDNCSISNTPFTGPGAVFTSWGFYSQSGHPMSMKATYRVF
jgi:hypothetical protein